MSVYDDLKNNMMKKHNFVEIEEEEIEEFIYPYVIYLGIKFKILSCNPKTNIYLCVEVKENGN